MSKEKENFNSKNSFKKQELTDNDVAPVAGGNVAWRWVIDNNKGTPYKEYAVFKLKKDPEDGLPYVVKEFNCDTLEEAKEHDIGGTSFGTYWDDNSYYQNGWIDIDKKRGR